MTDRLKKIRELELEENAELRAKYIGCEVIANFGYNPNFRNRKAIIVDINLADGSPVIQLDVPQKGRLRTPEGKIKCVQSIIWHNYFQRLEHVELTGRMVNLDDYDLYIGANK